MRWITINGRRYAQFEQFADRGDVVHAFATRPLDVAARSDGRAAERAANRATMTSDLGLDPQRLCHCVQVHEPTIEVVTQPRCGALDGRDGIITDQPGQPIMTFSADCPLLLAYDPRAGVLGMVHASWRCTVAGAALRLIEQMRADFGCDPRLMLAGVGPSAGPCCYAVKRDVYDAAGEFAQRDAWFRKNGERMTFDLWRANHDQLIAAGLPARSIESAAWCTICGGDAFYSFRREGAGCGHFGLLAAMI
ncbi:MAG: Polyphenol oxidase [Phycisphaerae bacterium]|nr:Polyphenol oxidase [Phycisphaerae bacterium]